MGRGSTDEEIIAYISANRGKGINELYYSRGNLSVSKKRFIELYHRVHGTQKKKENIEFGRKGGIASGRARRRRRRREGPGGGGEPPQWMNLERFVGYARSWVRSNWYDPKRSGRGLLITVKYRLRCVCGKSRLGKCGAWHIYKVDMYQRTLERADSEKLASIFIARAAQDGCVCDTGCYEFEVYEVIY